MSFLTLVLVSEMDITIRDRNVQVGTGEVIILEDGYGQGL